MGSSTRRRVGAFLAVLFALAPVVGTLCAWQCLPGVHHASQHVTPQAQSPAPHVHDHAGMDHGDRPTTAAPGVTHDRADAVRLQAVSEYCANLGAVLSEPRTMRSDQSAHCLSVGTLLPPRDGAIRAVGVHAIVPDLAAIASRRAPAVLRI